MTPPSAAGWEIRRASRRPVQRPAFALGAIVAVLVLLGAACAADSDQETVGSPPDATDETSGSGDTTDAGPNEVAEDGAQQSTAVASGDQPGDDEAEQAEDTRTAATPAVWAGCEDGFDCATIPVPLDHGDPDGPTIDIALIRRPATGTAVGSILVNPGGPGASGVRLIRNGFALDEDTMTDYHLVGFDPRGIGLSGGLECELDLTVGPRPDFSPDSGAERAELDDEAKAFAARCAESDADLLPHLGTESVVSDLELLRQAVGDERLNYVGLSYGTLIGLRYAEWRPETVGRMVLDGLVNPDFELVDQLRQQAQEFERAFQVLDEACGSELACPDGGVIAGYDAVLLELERNGPRGEVGPTELQVATLVTMYSERLWPRYTDALLMAQGGDYSGIEQLHDLYVGGTSYASYAAVSCIDSRPPQGGEAWDAFAQDLERLAPRFGAAIANEMRTCAYWPVTPDVDRGPITADGSGPILLLSTTGDAATPVANAVDVAAALVDASLVLVDDEGHTAYGRSFCVERIVAEYFASGRVPGALHRC